MPLVAITSQPLDLPALVAAVCERTGPAAAGRHGAVASFLGIVRGENRGRRVLRLEYEAYVPLAERALARIQQEATDQWPGVALGLHHRIGTLAIGEASVAIVAASAHRSDAFAACRFSIERVKQIVPIWKHEYFDDGDEWLEGVTADPEDTAALAEALRRSCR